MLHLLCHSVSLISPVNDDWLHVLAKIKCKFKFGGILWHLFQIGTLAVPFNVASGTMLNSCPVCWLFGSICIRDHKYCCQVSFSQCWHTVCHIASTHLLYICVCFFCPGGAALELCT